MALIGSITWCCDSLECRRRGSDLAVAEDRAVTGVDLSPDGQIAVVTDFGGVVYILRTSDGRLAQRIEVPNARCDDVKFSPSGKVLAVATTTVNSRGRITSASQGVVRFVRTGTWQTYSQTEPIEARIWSIAFSHDGVRLACALRRVASLFGTVLVKRVSGKTRSGAEHVFTIPCGVRRSRYVRLGFPRPGSVSSSLDCRL